MLGTLTINQTFARIGMESIPGKLEIQTSDTVMQISQKHARLEIRTEQPDIEIDQYEAFASAGLKSPLDLAKDGAQRGYQQALEYIAKVAQDGDTYAAIENGGDQIAEIAARDASDMHEFGLDYIPKTGPRFNARPWKVHIDPGVINDIGMRNGVTNNVIPGSININYTPKVLKMYMLQQPSIKINYQPGSKVDIML